MYISRLKLFCNALGISNYDGENAAMLRRIFVRTIHCILPEKVTSWWSNTEKSEPKCPIDYSRGFQGIELLINEKLDYECAKFIDFLKQKNGEPVEIKWVDFNFSFKKTSAL